MRRLFITIFLLTSFYATATDWDSPLHTAYETSPFGFRDDIVLDSGGSEDEFSIHLGTDMVPDAIIKDPSANVPIFAVDDGEVIIHYPPPGTIGKDGKIFKGHETYGGLIVIRHWDSEHNLWAFSLYAHMKQTWVYEHQKVRKGQSLGYVGSTGKSTGPHLHFAIYYDPLDLLPPDAIIRKSKRTK